MAPQHPHVQEPLTELYQQLLEINRQAFAAGHYDVAYHALMAALHCAQPLKDVDGLGEIKRVAEEQLQYIDRNQPQYEHSTRSAHQRGHVSVYALLARQAETRVRIFTAEAHWEATKGRKPASED